jgi:hypothetical protein
MIELRPEVQEFAEWVEMQMRDQEQKCQEWGYSPPELVRVDKHHTCFTGIGMMFTNLRGCESFGKVTPSRNTVSLVY